MKKVIALILTVMVILTGCKQEEKMVDVVEEKMVDVIVVDDLTYAELYQNKTVYKEFKTELECAETYTNAWYEVHGENSEKEIVDVQENDENSLTIKYNNGENATLKYDSELECAETYSNILYSLDTK